MSLTVVLSPTGVHHQRLYGRHGDRGDRNEPRGENSGPRDQPLPGGERNAGLPGGQKAGEDWPDGTGTVRNLKCTFFNPLSLRGHFDHLAGFKYF